MEERAKKSKDNKKNNRKTVWKRDRNGEETETEKKNG